MRFIARASAAALAVLVSVVVASSPTSALSTQEDSLPGTVVTTTPGAGADVPTPLDSPRDPGGTSMDNPVPLDWSAVPEHLRPRPAPPGDFAGQPKTRQFRIPLDDGALLDVYVSDGVVESELLGDSRGRFANLYQTDLVAPGDITFTTPPVYNVDLFGSPDTSVGG